MTTIDEVRFSLVWCRLVPETLAPPFGTLVSRAGFCDAVDADIPGVLTDVPWSEGGALKWSRFWSNYLRQPRKIRALSADAAWDYLVPFAVVEGEGSLITGPAPADAVDLDVWLFPHAVVLTATVTASGSWTPNEAAAAVAGLRQSNGYSLGGEGTRNLDGLASDLADAAARMLAPDATPTGVSNPLSIAAGIAATGDLADLDITKPDIAACVAGLAVLARKGTLKSDHLLGANTDDRRGGRVYWEKGGHTIWNAEAMIDLPDRPRCVQHNHTHALAVVAALSALVGWAADEVRAGRRVPSELHPLLARAMCRLAQLDEGDDRKTYRSGIVSQRIAPLRPAMQTVRQAGLPSDL